MKSEKNKAKQSKQQPTAATISKLQREIDALQKRLGQLEARFSKGGALTCAGLNVVNAKNELVAAISGTGQVLCDLLTVGDLDETVWSLRFNSLNGALEVWHADHTTGPSGKRTKIVSINDSGVGGIRLCMPDRFHTKSLIRFELKPGGGVMTLHDGKGKNVVQASAGSVGGSMRVESSDPQKGFASLEIDGSRSGQVAIVDSEGNLSAHLP